MDESNVPVSLDFNNSSGHNGVISVGIPLNKLIRWLIKPFGDEIKKR